MRPGINLSAPCYYQSDMKFADLMAAAAWLPAKKQWIVATEGYCRPGDYVLTAKGKGTLGIDTPDVPKDKQFCTFSGNGESYTLSLRSTNRRVLLNLWASDPADPIRDVSLRPAGLDPSAEWHPDFLASLRGFGMLRTLDFYDVNASTEADWSTARPAIWGWVVSLCNATGADPWICLPHPATDDYATQLGTLFRGLNPGIRPHVEYSNEYWNTAPPWAVQAAYVRAQAKAIGIQPQEFGARRAAQLQDAFAAAFGRPIFRVLSGQFDSPEATVAVAMRYAAANGLHFDGLACAPYIGQDPAAPIAWDAAVALWAAGLQDHAGDAVLDSLYSFLGKAGPIAARWRALADSYDVAALAYEWAPALAVPPSDATRMAIATHVQSMPRIGQLILDAGAMLRQYLDGGCFYAAIQPWTNGKFWGVAADLDQQNPKRAALARLVARSAS